MTLIEVQNLKKHFKVLNRREGSGGAFRDLFSGDYQTVKAVDDISFSINQGEIVGFLGPNGAGKSTTIKMMTGLLLPTEGELAVNDYHPYHQRTQYVANIGTVFGQRSQLWWDIPVIESFKILKEIYRIPDATYKQNLDNFNDMAGLGALYLKPVRSLSLGQRMLCDIAASFLHSPKTIFLDEPSIGLDVAIKRKIRLLIKKLNSELKTTVVLTSHDMGDVEELCERIILIDKGKLIFDGPTDNFTQSFGAYRTLILNVHDLSQADQLTRLKPAMANVIAGNDNLQVLPHGDSASKVVFRQDDVPLVTLMESIQKVLPLSDFSVQEMEMEQVILKVYEEGVG